MTIPNSLETHNEHWEIFFTNQLLDSVLSDDDNDDDHDGQDEMDIETAPAITTYHEAVKSLEDVQLFLEIPGHGIEVNNLGVMITEVAEIHCKQLMSSSRQTTVVEFFQ